MQLKKHSVFSKGLSDQKCTESIGRWVHRGMLLPIEMPGHMYT